MDNKKYDSENLQQLNNALLGKNGSLELEGWTLRRSTEFKYLI